MVSTRGVLKPGAIVATRARYSVILETSAEQCVLCPLVSLDETRHRADVEPAWCELVNANLKKIDVKVRCIPAVRDIKGLQYVGDVSLGLVERLRAAVLREQSRRTCEITMRRHIVSFKSENRVIE